MRPVLVLLLAVLCAAHGPAARAQGPVKNILVIGDSLSTGYGISLDDAWVTLLQNRLKEKGYGYRVVNASISGDTTSGGLRRIGPALERHSPEIVILELGGNDGLRATPPAVVRQNLAAMIQAAEEAGACVLLAGMLMPPNYGPAYTDAFARVYTDLAERRHVRLIPFFMDGVALDPSMMQADGIHPNAKAQPILLENVWVHLEEMVGG